jgi:hypothetical protein
MGGNPAALWCRNSHVVSLQLLADGGAEKVFSGLTRQGLIFAAIHLA